jgi:hypothetical protein
MSLEYKRIGSPFTKERLEEIDRKIAEGRDHDGIVESMISPADIVREFKESGKHFNLDYPGGILQFVKDFEDGKLDYEPM